MDLIIYICIHKPIKTNTMNKSAKLEKGLNVTVNVPFTYTIGEPGPVTGKILRTIEDCENEVRAEIDAGMDTLNMSFDSEAH